MNPKNAKQERIQDLLFSREISWQEIIYDLINTEQLDPWDVDIVSSYKQIFETNWKSLKRRFFCFKQGSSCTAFFLRIKSELLLSKYLKSIDEILFGKKKRRKWSGE